MHSSHAALHASEVFGIATRIRCSREYDQQFASMIRGVQ